MAGSSLGSKNKTKALNKLPPGANQNQTISSFVATVLLFSALFVCVFVSPSPRIETAREQAIYFARPAAKEMTIKIYTLFIYCSHSIRAVPFTRPRSSQYSSSARRLATVESISIRSSVVRTAHDSLLTLFFPPFDLAPGFRGTQLPLDIYSLGTSGVRAP